MRVRTAVALNCVYLVAAFAVMAAVISVRGMPESIFPSLVFAGGALSGGLWTKARVAELGSPVPALAGWMGPVIVLIRLITTASPDAPDALETTFLAAAGVAGAACGVLGAIGVVGWSKTANAPAEPVEQAHRAERQGLD